MLKYFYFFLLLILGIAEAKPPQIGPKDVKTKIEEIFKAHASFKKMTPEIIQRTLQNFLEELDPTKTYFLIPEIEAWLDPSESTVQRGLNGFQTIDFSLFQEIHSVYLSSIDRRAAFEHKITAEKLPQGVKSEEFKDPVWPSTEEELKTKLLRIRALQLEAAERLGEESKEKFLQRLNKRRINREAELTGANPEERFKITLSCLLKAIASALDSHTNYFTPSEANQFMIQVQQRLFGIGAQLKDNLDGLSIVRILENSPASQCQKLKINDKIISVNNEPIVGMDIIEAVDLIRGEKGTPVRLKLLRESGENEEKQSEMIEAELIRGEVVLEESRLESNFEPYGDGVIATFRLYSFYQDQKSSSSGDIKKAFEAIKKEQKIKGVMLDLRGNSGGLLAQAVSVAGLFINKGIVCSIKDNTGKLQHLREIEGKPIWDGPLFILTDRASASAAEIVAQALQDYGRALVVGDDRTFGKGSFQTFTLDPVHNPKVNPQGEYKVTRGRYYTVSGKSPQLKGVRADIVLPGILSNLDIGEEYAKFPLDNDEIEPHFEDDLSDVSPFHRLQLGPMYKYNLQTKLAMYEPYFETLRKNASLRLENNKNYQSFLTELGKKNFDASPVELFGQSDLQLVESYNVMKDLIFLMNADK
ncbi:MAG TPA: S41 family peptidase [Chlamydiales bacterium]|jgi:carboxyl-terminal processing protease|nr:S41 family peptidase [Chlamydiales bacterium]